MLALRALGRQYRVRRQQRAGLDLQLRAQASRFYPVAARALTRRPRRDMLAALAVAPSPGIALHVRSGRISEALREAGRTRSVPRAAAEILSELRTPFPRLPCLIEAGHGEALADTVGLLRAVDRSVERLQASLLAGAARHGAWPIVSSFPGLGQVTGALVLSEIGDDPARFSSARGLLCLAGVAPVTRQSGGMLSVRVGVSATDRWRWRWPTGRCRCCWQRVRAGPLRRPACQGGPAQRGVSKGAGRIPAWTAPLLAHRGAVRREPDGRCLAAGVKQASTVVTP
jgi:transposase